MNFKFLPFLIAISFILFSCGDKNNETSKSNTSEDVVLESDNPQLFEKDSFTYYNEHYKKIDVTLNQYFGFVFKADEQNLQWELDPKIDNNLAYVSEIYEPELDNVDKKADGKQYFTFQAIKKGNTKLKFKSKISNNTKTIHIHIK